MVAHLNDWWALVQMVAQKLALKSAQNSHRIHKKGVQNLQVMHPEFSGGFLAQNSNNPRWHIQFSISLEPMTCFSLSFQLQIIMTTTKTTGSVILTTYVNSSANLPRRQQLIQIEGCTSTWRSMQTQDVHETLGGTAISPAEVQLQPVKNTVNISNGRTIAMLQISATMTQQ